jgi:hypothetical protein
MIRAGRRDVVRDMADLAEAHGKSLKQFRKLRLHTEKGHPPPISSENARKQLWDGEQVDAFYQTGSYTPLNAEDSDDDLLDRHEAATLRGITPKSWDDYSKQPEMRAVVINVKGVDHWPRRAVREASRATGAPLGRPPGAGDIVPRGTLPSRVAELLESDPKITQAQVAETLLIHPLTARTALAEARGRRIADVLEEHRDLTPEQAANRLGYPARATRGAVQAAIVEQRKRTFAPYLESVYRAMADAGAQLQGDAPTLQVLDEGVCAASIVLADGGPIPVPALVWDERWGWRTATSRLHPIPRDHRTPPEGAGIRYLGGGIQPEPADVLDRLRNARKGAKRPPAKGCLG